MEYLQYKGSITVVKDGEHVLNLVISGIPSILNWRCSFKSHRRFVLNLVISGIPSIHFYDFCTQRFKDDVLNLVISGIPSIHIKFVYDEGVDIRFKPCYKWNTFNTSDVGVWWSND